MADNVRFVYMLRADHDGYFNRCGWLIKIGITKNVKNRISNIQSGCPFRVHIHKSARSNDPSGCELMFHKKLKEFRTHGEWFFVNDEIFDMIVDSLTEIEKEFRRLNALV